MSYSLQIPYNIGKVGTRACMFLLRVTVTAHHLYAGILYFTYLALLVCDSRPLCNLALSTHTVAISSEQTATQLPWCLPLLPYSGAWVQSVWHVRRMGSMRLPCMVPMKLLDLCGRRPDDTLSDGVHNVAYVC